MNQKLKTRVIRWLSIVSSTACVCGLTLSPLANVSFGQLPTPIGSGVQQTTPDWQLDNSNVMRAAPNAIYPQLPSGVVHAAGEILPPIVSPDQAAPKSRSTMLAPLNAQKPVVSASQVSPATAQWPAVNQNSGYGVTQASGTRNMPVEIQPMNGSGPTTQNPQASGSSPSTNPLPPIVNGNSVPNNGSSPPTSVVMPPSSTIVPPVPAPASQANDQTAPQTNYFQQPSQNPVYSPGAANGTCSSCGGAGCASCGVASQGLVNGDCGSCGPSGCYDHNDVDNSFKCAGSVACAHRYFIIDGMYFTETGTFGATNLGNLDNYDYEGGLRLTFGRREDSTAGREVSFFGTGNFNRTRDVSSATNNLNAAFVPGGGFGFAELGSFFNASRQVESTSLQLYSLEFNRTTWAWDVVQFYRGLRLFYQQDEYRLFSENNFGSGVFAMEAKNYLIGPHIGSEIFYDIGYRLSFSFRYEGGGYIDFANLDTLLVNNGTTFIDRSADHTGWTWNASIGASFHFQLAPKVRLRAGYDFLWLWNIATAVDSVPFVMDGLAGQSFSSSDNMAYSGGSFGLEIYR